MKISFSEATKVPLDFVVTLLKEKDVESLDDNQIFILSALWKNRNLKYKDIQEELGCSLDTVKGSAANLWKLLGEAIGEKISKGNFKSKLIQYIENNNRNNSSSASDTNTTISLNLKTEISEENKKIKSSRLIESPESVVPLTSPFYIQRKEELLAYTEITQPGALIRIKGQENSGKTSFMSRLVACAQSLNYQTITINFHAIDNQNFDSIEVFWKWFCRYLTRKLDLEDSLEKYWFEEDSPNVNCGFYLEKYLLDRESRPILLALDRIEHVIARAEIANEFFACLRSWHENRAERLWDKLRYILIESEQKIKMKNTQSPFNVGLEIELVNFSVQEIIKLAEKHDLIWSQSEIDQLKAVFGERVGNPKLIRRILYYLILNNLDLDRFLKSDAISLELFQ